MLLVDWVAIGFDEDLFWSLTPRQLTRHFDGARKRMRRETNNRMEQAWWAGVIAKSEKTPPLGSLLIDVDPTTRRHQSWQEMKAALQLALPSQAEVPDGRQLRYRRAPGGSGA